MAGKKYFGREFFGFLTDLAAHNDPAATTGNAGDTGAPLESSEIAITAEGASGLLACQTSHAPPGRGSSVIFGDVGTIVRRVGQ